MAIDCIVEKRVLRARERARLNSTATASNAIFVRSRWRTEAPALLLAQSGDTMCEPRDLTLRRVAVHDVLLRGANDHRLGFRHRRVSARAIAGADRLFNFAHRGPQARAPRLVDDSAAHGLARGLFGRLRIGHDRYRVFVKRRL